MRRFGELKNCRNFGATNVKKGLKVIRVQNTLIEIRRGK